MEVGQRELIYWLPAFVMALVMQEEFCLRYLFCFCLSLYSWMVLLCKCMYILCKQGGFPFKNISFCISFSAYVWRYAGCRFRMGISRCV